MSSTDASRGFFADLSGRGYVPALAKVGGSVRFDIAKGERTNHVLVAFSNGHVSVREGMERADCVVHTDVATFEALAHGDTTAMAAMLRGAIRIEGDARLAVLVQRIFPGRSSQENLENSRKRSASR